MAPGLCFAVYFVAAALPLLGAADKCNIYDQDTQCRCEVGNTGRKLDLTGVGNNFQSIPGSDTDQTYSWGPCTNELNFGDTCVLANNPAMCQKVGTTTYLVGKYTQADYEVNVTLGTTTVTYTGGDDQRVGVIKMTCSSDNPGAITFVAESPQLTYNFNYAGVFACLSGGGGGGGGGGSSKSTSISVGSILLIVFFAALVVYFVAGLLIMRFARGAEGSEMVPNRYFWASLPGLIKDGALLLVSPCSGGRGYEKMPE